ncbi:MAG: hypothetical protein K9M84_07345 [Spirochaetia bacterium]|nr:hypothetical protein [Spirochaetia bacterium]
MFTAALRYTCRAGCVQQAATIWEEIAGRPAAAQDGLIHMQLLMQGQTLLALGVWEDQHFAQQYMQTGVFSRLMEGLGGLLEGDPVPESWETLYISSS